jgi:hypothetical protein
MQPDVHGTADFHRGMAQQACLAPNHLGRGRQGPTRKEAKFSNPPGQVKDARLGPSFDTYRFYVVLRVDSGPCVLTVMNEQQPASGVFPIFQSPRISRA